MNVFDLEYLDSDILNLTGGTVVLPPAVGQSGIRLVLEEGNLNIFNGEEIITSVPVNGPLQLSIQARGNNSVGVSSSCRSSSTGSQVSSTCDITLQPAGTPFYPQGVLPMRFI